MEPADLQSEARATAGLEDDVTQLVVEAIALQHSRGIGQVGVHVAVGEFLAHDMCGSAGQTHSGPDDQPALAEACAHGVEQLGAPAARARDALSRTRDDVELENVVDLGAAAMAGRPDAADAQRPADGQVLKLGHDRGVIPRASVASRSSPHVTPASTSA